MVLLRQFGATLRRVGLKVAGGVQSVGRKVSDVLMRAAPVVSGFTPELAGGLAAVGGIARGVSSVAGLVPWLGSPRGRCAGACWPTP